MKKDYCSNLLKELKETCDKKNIEDNKLPICLYFIQVFETKCPYQGPIHSWFSLNSQESSK